MRAGTVKKKLVDRYTHPLFHSVPPTIFYGTCPEHMATDRQYMWYTNHRMSGSHHRVLYLWVPLWKGRHTSDTIDLKRLCFDDVFDFLEVSR